MSISINRVSASSMAAMTYQVGKPNRVTSPVATRVNSSATSSDTQSTNVTSTAGQSQASFQYAQAALSGVATTNGVSGSDIQVGTMQAVNSYAQAEQAGQMLDLTA